MISRFMCKVSKRTLRRWAQAVHKDGNIDLAKEIIKYAGDDDLKSGCALIHSHQLQSIPNGRAQYLFPILKSMGAPILGTLCFRFDDRFIWDISIDDESNDHLVKWIYPGDRINVAK